MIITLVIAVMWVCPVTSFVAYDCSHKRMNFTRISTLSTYKCEELKTTISSRKETIQLVQLQTEFKVTTHSCKVEISRNVFHCGWNDYLSLVPGSHATFIHNIGRDVCEFAHSTGTISFMLPNGKMFTKSGMKNGPAYSENINLAGTTSGDGDCTRGEYSDPFGSWTEVVATGIITIKMSSSPAIVMPDANKIYPRGGLSCEYSLGWCEDGLDGETFWKPIDDDNCKSLRHKVIYEGDAIVTYEREDLNRTSTFSPNSVVSVTTPTTLFSFRITGVYNLCNLASYTTEHPKIIIVQHTGGRFIFAKTSVDAADVDFLTYTNSKFIFLERNTRTNFESLYRHIKQQRCLLEQQLLETQLVLAYLDPNLFSFTFMKAPGYTATLLGEVVYISKCQPVDVEINVQERCYHELPVRYKNTTYYMTPKTHLLLTHGREVTCNGILPPTYYLESRWFSIVQRVMEVSSPTELNVARPQEWEYTSPRFLADAGIYSQDDLEKFREHLMYGPTIQAVQNVISRGFMGYNPDMQGGSIEHLLEGSSIDKLTHKITEKLFGWFTLFGNISAGVIGLMITFKLVKWSIDTIIHGTALYEAYGLSLWLLGACWDSITVCFLRLSDKHTYAKTPADSTGDVKFDISNVRVEHPLLTTAVVPEAKQASAPVYPVVPSPISPVLPSPYDFKPM